MAATLKVKSAQKIEDYVNTQYYCQVTEKQIVNVVMELSTIESAMSKEIPSRFVLVIDVSTSMNNVIGEETLLNRVKTFARMVVEKVAKSDWISIVTFADDAQVQVELTKMTKTEKRTCIQVIDEMKAMGNTNLESGLTRALNELKRVPSTGARDMIIIFTDGVITVGEKDPAKLVDNYRSAQKDMGHDKCIPLSAFTIGNYVPDTLHELSWHLGSEAFYWLSPTGEFEADMLMPIFLRKETRITDITIEMNCLNAVRFADKTTTENQKHHRESSEDRMTFFIHSIPRNACKNTTVTLDLPQDKINDPIGKRILHVTVRYLNWTGDKRCIDEYIEFHAEAIKNLKRGNQNSYQDAKISKITAFYMSDSIIKTTRVEAQKALAVIAYEKGRYLTVQAMRNIAARIVKEKVESHRNTIAEAIDQILGIKQEYLTLVGNRTSVAMRIVKDANNWIEMLNFGTTMLSDSESAKSNAGKLYSMSSSVEAQMPTTSGIFKSVQPYMLDNIATSVQKSGEELRKVKKKRKVLARIFAGKTLLLSELLRGKKVGERQETLEEIIVKCGGRMEYIVMACPYMESPGWYEQKTFPDTFLISSADDYVEKTFTVSEALRMEIPILVEEFLFDCVKTKRFQDPAPYTYPPFNA